MAQDLILRDRDGFTVDANTNLSAGVYRAQASSQTQAAGWCRMEASPVVLQLIYVLPARI